MQIRWSGIAILGVLWCLAAWSCRQDKVAEEKRGGFEWENRRFMKKSADCETDSFRCAIIKASYLLPVAGPEPARSSISDTLMQFVRRSLAVFAVADEEIPGSLDAIANSFLEEYELMQHDEPGYEIPWSVETSGELLSENGQVVCMEITNFAYAGGVHPNSYVTLLNFDAISGKKLLLRDIVTDTLQLKRMAEAKFREMKGLEPGDSLSDAGFFWGDAFTLPENIGFKGDSLLFYYNPYEIAAYVEGPTTFTLPLSEVKSILRKRKKH
jgi:hypothetical protein